MIIDLITYEKRSYTLKLIEINYLIVKNTLLKFKHRVRGTINEFIELREDTLNYK